MIQKWILTGIRGYRKFISPLLGSQCRFYPPCSKYAEEAVMRKGWVRGSGASLLRILKCNPFHPGGVDDVK